MKNNNIIKYGLILFIITAVSTGLVSMVYNVTIPIIEAQQIEKDNNARKEILPDAADFQLVEKEFDNPIVEVYEGLNSSGEVIGYTIKTATKGYGGDVEVTTGITTEGEINGISLGSMSETPGLGAKATNEAFYGQYAGKSAASNLEVLKNGTPSETQISAIAGATITSNAVTTGVNAAIDLYNNELMK